MPIPRNKMGGPWHIRRLLTRVLNVRVCVGPRQRGLGGSLGLRRLLGRRLGRSVCRKWMLHCLKILILMTVDAAGLG